MSDPIVFRKTFQKGPGVFQVDHVPTGVRYVGVASDPLKQAQLTLKKITGKKSPYRTMYRRHLIDPEWDLLVHHTRTLTAAKKAAKEYVDTISPLLVVNIKDYQEGKSNGVRKSNKSKVKS